MKFAALKSLVLVACLSGIGCAIQPLQPGEEGAEETSTSVSALSLDKPGPTPWMDDPSNKVEGGLNLSTLLAAWQPQAVSADYAPGGGEDETAAQGADGSKPGPTPWMNGEIGDTKPGPTPWNEGTERVGDSRPGPTPWNDDAAQAGDSKPGPTPWNTNSGDTPDTRPGPTPWQANTGNSDGTGTKAVAGADGTDDSRPRLPWTKHTW